MKRLSDVGVKLYTMMSPRERREARELYAMRQGGKCFHCEADLDGPPSLRVRKMRVNTSLFPAGFFEHPLHLHHDHKTGKVIGTVHARCNAVLWQYEGS